jgi:hypothetical protein
MQSPPGSRHRLGSRCCTCPRENRRLAGRCPHNRGCPGTRPPRKHFPCRLRLGRYSRNTPRRTPRVQGYEVGARSCCLRPSHDRSIPADRPIRMSSANAPRDMRAHRTRPSGAQRVQRRGSVRGRPALERQPRPDARCGVRRAVSRRPGSSHPGAAASTRAIVASTSAISCSTFARSSSPSVASAVR